MKLLKAALTAAVFTASAATLSAPPALADGHKVLDEINFSSPPAALVVVGMAPRVAPVKH